VKKTDDPSEKALVDADLMRSWGEMNARWDSIEQVLWQSFDALIEDDPDATRAIFFSQTSHAARRTMLAKLAEWALRDRPEELKKLKGVLKSVAARSGTRNDLAHGEWGEIYDEEGRGELKRVPVTPNAFEGIVRVMRKRTLSAYQMK
jgi:hypothetical protein